VLRDDIPRCLKNDFIHWLVEDGEDWFLEFRPQDHLWSSCQYSWKMAKTADQVRLRDSRGDTTVFDPRSSVVQSLHLVFRRLEALKTDIMVTSTKAGGFRQGIIVVLPRYQLRFSTNAQDMLESSDFPGAVISSDQSIGALYGLESAVVLEGSERQDSIHNRRLLVPYSTISIASTPASHPRVTVVQSSAERHIPYTVYEIDDIVGRLIEDGMLWSRLYLIYLHGVTSSYAPDPLTGKTGM
jgi:hypothetical protein